MTKIEEIQLLRKNLAEGIKTKFLPKVAATLKSYHIQELKVEVYKQIFSTQTFISSSQTSFPIKIDQYGNVFIGTKVSNTVTGASETRYDVLDLTRQEFAPAYVDYFVNLVQSKLLESTKTVDEEIERLRELGKIISGGNPEFFM